MFSTRFRSEYLVPDSTRLRFCCYEIILIVVVLVHTVVLVLLVLVLAIIIFIPKKQQF